jgi:ABC-type transporter Mla subunit MlaD
VKLAILPVALAAVLAAGCGGGGSSSGSSSSPSPKDWANNLCSAISTWSHSVKKSGQTLQSGKVTKDNLKQTTDDIKSATHQLAEDIKGLGKPDTDAGQDAKDAMDKLSKQIDGDVEEMQNAVDNAGSGAGGAVAAASTIASTLSKMGTQIGTAASSLQSLDAKGELEKGFKDATACQNLTG